METRPQVEADKQPAAPVTLGRVLHNWWPLAASWMLMGIELPMVSAILARLSHPEVNLAAYGGVVFPLSMIVEAPIIMLLSASNALSRDWPSYRLIRRVMMFMGAALTCIHALIAFTPLFDLVVGGLIHPPAEVLGPARIGLMIMLPWTWSIAYRRCQQGVLIRAGRSHLVGIGTVVRLGANALVLLTGYFLKTWPGIVVGSAAVAAGVVSEAVFIGLSVRPVLRKFLRPAPLIERTLTLRDFSHFYVPLALTSVLNLVGAPMISAGLSRMPLALASLAVWPVLTGVVFILRALGFALQEVVVALLDQPDAPRHLRRFALFLGSGTVLVLLVFAGTPLARIYFTRVAAISPSLCDLAARGILLSIPMPALSAWLAWYQGIIVVSRKTRWITESVVAYLLITTLSLGVGVLWSHAPGLYVGLMAVLAGTVAQVSWLAYRSRPVARARP